MTTAIVAASVWVANERCSANQTKMARRTMHPRLISVQDCISNFGPTANAAASRSRVAAHSAVDNHHTETAAHNPATVGASRVAADRAINDGQTRIATIDATAIRKGEVTTDRA